MKKRNIVRLTAFLVAAIFVLSGFMLKEYQKTKRYELVLKNGYSRSLDEFNTAINNIAVTLNKAKYVTTPAQISGIAAKLLTEAELSKTALSQLPVSEELSSLNLFLSQVGNYAMAVSQQLITSGTTNEDTTQNIVLLSNTAQKISELVSNSQITYNNSEYWATELDRKVDETIESTGVAVAFGQIEDGFSDYPTLIYDGPYSDHILEKEPTMLKGAKSVSQNEALKIAAVAAECEENALEADGSVMGNIPSYRFIGDGITVAVSQKGGFTLFMRKDRQINDIVLSYEQAREKAKRYLTRTGKNGFRETYYFTTEGVCVVNFAYVDGETICYTDLIKVGVAMDNGEIVLYEAGGYISNHTERAFETPLYRIDQAERVVSEKLNVKSTAMALIPTSGKNEARCYEFTCTTDDDEEILVYINTQTLAEEQVLILLKEDGGTLVK